MPASESVYTIEGSLLTDIASAIRTKSGSSSAFTPAQMASEILAIPTGGGGSINNLYDWTSLNSIITDFELENAATISYLQTNVDGFVGSSLVMPFGSASNNALVSLSAPNCKYVGWGAFFACCSLRSIYLPECEFIESWAFQSCQRLETIELPKCSYIKRGAFYGGSRLRNISLPLCEYIDDSAFYSINSSYSVSLYAPLCKYVGREAFYNADLNDIYLPECEVIGLGAFYYVRGISNLYLPKCKIIEPTAFAYAFNWQIYTREVHINLPECLSIGDSAFLVGSDPIRTISIPKCKYIGRDAFSACSRLSVISLPACEKIGPWAFRACSRLSSVYLNSSSVCRILYSSRIFISTPIESGSGTIYVPSSLYSDYYNDSVWSWYRSVLTSY